MLKMHVDVEGREPIIDESIGTLLYQDGTRETILKNGGIILETGGYKLLLEETERIPEASQILGFNQGDIFGAYPNKMMVRSINSRNIARGYNTDQTGTVYHVCADPLDRDKTDIFVARIDEKDKPAFYTGAKITGIEYV